MVFGLGFKAIAQPGHEAHDHNELILRFCRAAGLSDEQVHKMKMPPAWWARSVYYYNTVATELPVGIVLAMQTTQEGQMPGLIREVLLPAFEKYYGFKRNAPEIEFFTEHAEGSDFIQYFRFMERERGGRAIGYHTYPCRR